MLGSVLTALALAAVAQGLPITDDKTVQERDWPYPPNVPILLPPITGPIKPSDKKKRDEFTFPFEPITGPLVPDAPVPGGPITPDPYVPGGGIKPSE
jgi:hypothetical protein